MFEDIKVGYIDGLVQACSNSIANAQELLQYYPRSSICTFQYDIHDVYFRYSLIQ